MAVEKLKISEILTLVKKTVTLAYRSDPKGFIIKASHSIIFAPFPAAKMWIAKLILDKLVFFYNNPGDPIVEFKSLSLLLGAEFVLFTIQDFLSLMIDPLKRNFDDKFELYIRKLILEKMIRLELSYLDDSDNYNLIESIQRSRHSAFQVNNEVLSIFSQITGLAAFFFVAFHVNSWIAVLIFLGAIPAFWIQLKLNLISHSVNQENIQSFRSSYYIEHLITHRKTAKEIRALNLGHYFIDKFDHLLNVVSNNRQALDESKRKTYFILNAFKLICYYVSYSWVVYSAILKKITLGDMTLYLGFFNQAQSSIESLFHQVNSFHSVSLELKLLYNFLEDKENMISETPHELKIEEKTPRIEFKNVCFKYKKLDSHFLLNNLSFVIEPGEKVALVGENGAGKTTIIKLITGLYKPSSGAVLIDGKPTSEMGPEELNHKIGVIFQDFVQYEFSLRDNIRFGNLNKGDDENILMAAGKSGAVDVINSFPMGLDQELGTISREGSELSGGQWQKVALARAFIQKGKVLVLDEPTAALDPRTEYEIFSRFQDLTQGKTTILVSHRFSTVKIADKIIVIEKGFIIEQGSHKDLMAKQGVYFELFNLQAKGYQD
jgi:ATP-binding cassette subfamily B protein